MISFKPGAHFDFVEPQTLRALADLAEAWSPLFPETPFVVTAGTDGTHKVGSKHYLGLAFDARTHHLPILVIPQLSVLMTRFRDTHPGWRILLESPNTPEEHLHVEYE